MSQTAETFEVLTLEEAAAFLRVPPDAVMRLVFQQGLPGRLIEGQWRFLRTAWPIGYARGVERQCCSVKPAPWVRTIPCRGSRHDLQGPWPPRGGRRLMHDPGGRRVREAAQNEVRQENRSRGPSHREYSFGKPSHAGHPECPALSAGARTDA